MFTTSWLHRGAARSAAPALSAPPVRAHTVPQLPTQIEPEETAILLIDFQRNVVDKGLPKKTLEPELT